MHPVIKQKEKLSTPRRMRDAQPRDNFFDIDWGVSTSPPTLPLPATSDKKYSHSDLALHSLLVPSQTLTSPSNPHHSLPSTTVCARFLPPTWQQRLSRTLSFWGSMGRILVRYYLQERDPAATEDQWQVMDGDG